MTPALAPRISKRGRTPSAPACLAPTPATRPDARPARELAALVRAHVAGARIAPELAAHGLNADHLRLALWLMQPAEVREADVAGAMRILQAIRAPGLEVEQQPVRRISDATPAEHAAIWRDRGHCDAVLGRVRVAPPAYAEAYAAGRVDFLMTSCGGDRV